MKYVAILNKEEMYDFLDCVYELQSLKDIIVIISPQNRLDVKEVALIPGKHTSLLESSFQDGMLKGVGWDKKFQRIE